MIHFVEHGMATSQLDRERFDEELKIRSGISFATGCLRFRKVSRFDG
jgi:hypothetical protein